MSTKEIADAVLALCQAGHNADATEKYYADDVISVEAQEPITEVKGKEAVKGMSTWWTENHEIHSHSARGPWVNGDQFALEFTYDITFKPTGLRHVMNEIAVYTVRDGKISHQKFLYAR